MMRVEVKKLDGNNIGVCNLDDAAGYGLQKGDIVSFPVPFDTRARYKIDSKEFSFFSDSPNQSPELLLRVTEL